MRIVWLIVLIFSTVVCFGDYYVATDGSDANPGTLAQPFFTLECARTNIRALSHPLSSPVTVWLRGGRYYRQNAYALSGSQDSGTPASPVTYKNYSDEIPILIGGLIATNFVAVTDGLILARLTAPAQANVLVSDLTSQGITNLGVLTNHGYYTYNFDTPELPFQSELIFQDTAMQLARWPNALTSNPRTNWALIVSPNTTNTFGYTGANPTGWLEPSKVMVHGFWDYDFGDSWQMVTAIDTNANIVTLTSPNSYGSQFWGASPHRSGQRFYWFNILEELDMAGEYYIDYDNGKLYFWPSAAITNGACIVSTTTNLVTMVGVSNVSFYGITFEAGKSPLVLMTSGGSNFISHCTFRGGSADGIKMIQCTNSGVDSCVFSDLGERGVNIYGTGDRLNLSSGNNFVTFSTFSNIQRLCMNSKSAIDIADSYATYFNCIGVYMSHNLFRDLPGTAVTIFGNDHLFEYNEVYNFNTEIADSGAIYTGGDPTFYGSVIRYNYIHDGTMGLGGAANFTGVHAVYADGAQNNLAIYGNVFANVDHGVFINGGRDNIIQNNIFVDITNMITSKLVPFAVLCNQSPLAGGGNDFTNRTSSHWQRLTNIPYQNGLWSSRYPTLATITNGPWVDNINYVIATNNVLATNICWNFYTNTVSPYTGTCFRWGAVTGPVASAADQTNAVVVNNLTNADPLFVNYAARDFNLQESSPAWALGWVRIPLELIGPNPRYPTVGNVQTLRVGTMRMAQ